MIINDIDIVATAAPTIAAAVDAGCTRIDTAIGGMGGCPFACDEGLTGNTPTEALVRFAEERGLEVGVNAAEFAKARALQAELFEGKGWCPLVMEAHDRLMTNPPSQ